MLDVDMHLVTLFDCLLLYKQLEMGLDIHSCWRALKSLLVQFNDVQGTLLDFDKDEQVLLYWRAVSVLL